MNNRETKSIHPEDEQSCDAFRKICEARLRPLNLIIIWLWGYEATSLFFATQTIKTKVSYKVYFSKSLSELYIKSLTMVF